MGMGDRESHSGMWVTANRRRGSEWSCTAEDEELGVDYDKSSAGVGETPMPPGKVVFSWPLWKNNPGGRSSSSTNSSLSHQINSNSYQ